MCNFGQTPNNLFLLNLGAHRIQQIYCNLNEQYPKKTNENANINYLSSVG